MGGRSVLIEPVRLYCSPYQFPQLVKNAPVPSPVDVTAAVAAVAACSPVSGTAEKRDD
jgi:hypothetical protein